MSKIHKKVIAFDPEIIYGLLFKEQWLELLDLIYKHHKTIWSDVRLQQAAQLIEIEFFRKIKDYPVEDEVIIEVLETFYQLNHTKQYMLQENHYMMLMEELALRRPTNYGSRKNASSKSNNSQLSETLKSYFVPGNDPLPEKWIEIFNRLFELINILKDPDTYYSGPQFLNVVQLFSPYHPDYEQYMMERKRLGKSETRKTYYREILENLPIRARMDTINKILERVKPFDIIRVKELEVLLYGQEKADSAGSLKTNENPTVFVSYTWDNEDHKMWVLKLARKLCNDDINVILDRHVLRPGKSVPHFAEQSIAKSDKVLVIFTPTYKLKADNRSGGAGYEYSILNADLYKNQVGNDKIIPLLRSGNQEVSIPDFMHQYIHLDFRDDGVFDSRYADLLCAIKNLPMPL
ncbi:toll/interleukin-1 receptor domain-containing protein [Pedobacter sp. GR22-6]|uniref:toll/interleukin-1 receptor domain-containing protein n=1 Tax=Pedobacter sp. GR22-6 TaxID=3127957 RepID=UPI00307F58F9